MKKIILLVLIFSLVLSFSIPVLAMKKSSLPEQANTKAKENYQKMLVKHEKKQFLKAEKNNGVEKYDFYLSGDIMPTPPEGDYGQFDIEGSDIDSKLLVNQSSEEYLASLTGIMKGLAPITEYTVYLSNGYTQTSQTWNILGDYTYNFTIDGIDYLHTLTIDSCENNIISGTGTNDTSDEIVTGTIIGDIITLHVLYPNGYYFDATQTMEEDGTFSGTAIDSNSLVADIILLSGEAVKEDVQVIATTWTGYLSENISSLTFITDDEGNGAWHINIKYEDLDLDESDTFSFSIWINDNTTILISEIVTLTIE